MAQDHVCVAPLADPGMCPICEARINATGTDTPPPPRPSVPERLAVIDALTERRRGRP